MLNKTHDLAATSWVDSANDDGVDFPVQNLPFCVFSTAGDDWRIGVGIGDQILDVKAAVKAGILASCSTVIQQALSEPLLNDFMALKRRDWQEARLALFEVLAQSGAQASAAQNQQADILVAQSGASFQVPMNIGDFTDFECSRHHAKRMQRIMSGKSTPSINGYWQPRAYHGRSSSIVISGTPIYLPWGQVEDSPTSSSYQPCVNFDYELEFGIVIGTGNERNQPIKIDEAEDYVFGVNLINDWSARDIQKFERFPLGPFLGKNHGTSISPWIVTFEALAPYRNPQPQPGPEYAEPHRYLQSERNKEEGGLDMNFDVLVSSEKMRKEDVPAFVNSSNRSLDVHWTVSQILAQHTVSGCNLRPGDLIGSGTISGPESNESACLFELSEGGKQTWQLPNGETRTFLVAGDEVTITGEAKRDGFKRIGFGNVVGRVYPPCHDG
ncbi:UNVERIFIED_CONTAM: hypothetical protein GTU68_061753 [Idotea baltica]|nr:hypothetical protein [Idotea baltica]